MDNLLSFYKNIEKIKHVERNGWINIGVKGVRDTIGSHSFGAAIVGWLLAKEEGLDENRIIKLLLIHDLIMAHMQDITPEDKAYKDKREIENEAGERLLATIPEDLKEEFAGLFHEYQQEETQESMLAREADKLETILQSICYSEKLNRNEAKQFLESYQSKFRSDAGKKILAQLQQRWHAT